MLPLLQDAFVIAIVTFSVTVSLAQVFARQFSYSIDSNQVINMEVHSCHYDCGKLLGFVTHSQSRSHSVAFFFLSLPLPLSPLLLPLSLSYSPLSLSLSFSLFLSLPYSLLSPPYLPSLPSLPLSLSSLSPSPPYTGTHVLWYHEHSWLFLQFIPGCWQSLKVVGPG